MTAPVRAGTIHAQAIRFGLLSGLSFVCNLGITVVTTEWAGLPSYVAVAIAMVSVTVMNFCMLRWFVFPSDESPWPKQFMGFVMSIAGFRAGEFLAFVLLCSLAGLPYLPVYSGILVTSLVFKFFFLRRTVFAGPSPLTPPPAAPVSPGGV